MTDTPRGADRRAGSVKEPSFRWAQRAGALSLARTLLPAAQPSLACPGTLSISIPALSATVNEALLEPAGALSMALRDREGATYRLQLQLHAPVNVTSDWWRVLPREVVLTVQKRQSGPYWRHLLRDGRRPPTMSIDWSRWVDEARDGVRWNELADRRWDWWKPEKATVNDDDEL